MVLFLNKKKLQEQKPLVNNTYQGKYDYSQMQYLPEDQRFGFDTLVKETDKDGKIIKKENKLSLLQRITPTAEASEVARDTNKKSLWDIFFKKPKMVFPVGEGMSEEETKKAKEILSEEDLAVKGYREGSFFTRPSAGFNDPMAHGFLKDIEIAQQTLFSLRSTREEKIEAFNFLMQPIISASQPLEPTSGKIPTTTPKGKIKSSVLKIFAKEKNPLSIERSLRQMGIDDINAKSLSFDLAKANTADEVGDALVAFSNKPLSIASKNVADDVASGVAKQATSISDDLAKLKPQTDDLLAEARKYKSAEEFVRAQGQLVYRGDATPIKLSEMDTTKVFNSAEKEALGAFNNTPGLYFTDSVANAKSYGKNLTEVSVKPTANVINVSDAPKILRRADVEKIIRSNPRIKDWAMNWDENFDKAIKQITDSVMAEKDGNEFLKAIWSDGGFLEGDFVKAMQNAGIDGLKVPKEGVNHFVIYNKDALKTKSQLTDIWNKANKNNADDALINEAKKYKSAGEFVNKEPSYFHATKAENVSLIEKQGFSGKVGDMSRASGGTMQEGVFLYPEKSSAEVFGKNFKSPSVLETKVNGKIYDANTNTKYGWEDNLQTQEIAKDPKIISQLKKDGYVGVKSTELGTDAVFVFDKSAVKTKSQLTDIWNKANQATHTQATSISDDLAKLKLQTIEPQIAETNLIKEAKILRGTKGMTADDIMAKYPNIKLKRDIPATTISGVKTTIKEGEKLTPYELKGNKILLQDGKTYIVSKNQFQNIKGQSVVAEGKPFAPELEGVDETVKGASKWRGDELYDNGNRLADIYKREDKWYYRSDFVEESPAFKTRKEAMENAEADVLGVYSGNETKYSQYTLPGGENYREILIKAPESKVNEGDLISFKEWKKDNIYGTQEEYNKVIERAKKSMDKMVAKDRTFISSHWDEPNVIAHLRLNERTYKGKKVTFMEELQSDWAREGRDKGFVNPNIKEPQLPEGWRMISNGDTFQVVNKQGVPVPDKLYGTSGAYGGNKDIAIAKATGDDAYLKSKESGIPNHPLLKNWQELSIKRALKDAVDNNSDYFAWINGEQTSARYNLATQVKEVLWKNDNSGAKSIFLDAKEGRAVNFTVDNKGIVSKTANSVPADWKGKKLDEVLGKGLADKIMAKESGTLSGEGLKFGGEWASNLYDKQVKNIVEDLTGQKVEMLDMGLEVSKDKTYTFQDWETKKPITEKDLKIGRQIDVYGETNLRVITDVLGDGKFKATDAYKLGDKKLSTVKESEKETYDLADQPKVTMSKGQMGIKLTPEVKNKIKGIAPEIKTSGKMFEVKTEEIKSEIPKPAVIQGETFTLGTSKTTQPTIKELKLDLKATQKEIKNAQIAREKANKLERKEQKVREEAIANLQRFRGNTENIKAELEKRNLSQEDIDNIILEDGTKLNDTIKVKRNSDGSLSDVITKKEIDDLKASYTDEIPKNKWQKRNVLVDGKEVATNAIQSIELPYAYFERKGLSSIYDQVIKSGRDAEVLKNSFIQKFKDADLFKNGSWFTADRFNIDKTEAKAVSEYYLGRQGKTKPVELSSLPEKSQKFIKIFDEIINETTEPFYQMASKMGKQPGVVENYAPLMTSEDIKLIDEGGAQDWLFRKHPAFSALKERVKKAPVEVYEKDYRKVATRWLEGMSQFLEMSDTTNHLKYLIGSDEFKNIVKDSDYAIISKWLKDITTPKTPDTLIKKTFTPLSQLTRKGVAMGALGLNYATVLKQALTQIPIAIIEKSLPKASSEYAKAFGINVKDLPSISKRKGDIAIQDLQGKISRIFTGSITQFDKMNAQTALNGLLDKEYNKVLKEGVPITKETQNLIEKNAQDKIDMWFGGFFKGQRPEAYREEIGNFILMFTYPLTSQTNGFFRHILQAKGFKGNIKAVAEVLASVVGIAYMERVIENLSPQWSDEKEMTKDILISLTGNIPLVGDIAYSIATGQSLNISPVISNIDNIVRAISKGDGEKIAWTLAETLGLPKQIRRVKEGLKIMEDGGITDNNGKMLAPVQGAMEYIRAFLRGKYGPLASQDYIRNVGAKNEDKRWFFPEVEFLQNAGSAEKPGDGSYQRKAEIYKTFDRQKKKEFYNMLSEGQQKKLDNALKGITPKLEGRKSLSEIFK